MELAWFEAVLLQQELQGGEPIRSQRDLDSFLKDPWPCGFPFSQRSPSGYNFRKFWLVIWEANWIELASQGEHRYSKNYLVFTLHLGDFRLLPMAYDLWPLPTFAAINTFPSHCPSHSLLLLAVGSLNIPYLSPQDLPTYFLFLLPEKALLLHHYIVVSFLSIRSGLSQPLWKRPFLTTLAQFAPYPSAMFYQIIHLFQALFNLCLISLSL